MARQTRHGLYGGARPRYGSFAGKTENVTTAIPGARHAPTARVRPHAPKARLS